MSKKRLSEGSITGFIGKFFDDMLDGTQKRFIAKAKKKGVPPKVTYHLQNIEKEVEELKKILDDL